MKKAFMSLCAFLSCLLCLSAPAAEAKTFLSIATGGEGGVYYPLGLGLAQVLTKHLPDVEVKAEPSDASIANVNLIAEHKAALAIVQNDVAFRAVNGEKPFKKPVENLTMIASLYPEQVQCIVPRGKGIKTVSDLKGKRVSVGEPGSGTSDNVGAILLSAGIKYAELDAEFFDFVSTVEHIYDGHLDAGFVLAGYPTAAVTALADRKDIDIVAFEEELLDKLTAEHPFFTKDVIPAGTYKGVDHDTATAAVTAILVCDSGMSDDLVYGITKAIFENLTELAPAHAKAELISLEKALNHASIPVHPGAAKYYQGACPLDPLVKE